MPESKDGFTLADDPSWYKDAVIYELHVRAFCDANGDGIGDFEGLTTKLDYLQDLGITAIWLLPFYPSPLKDDGYDIADYTNVHPSYGTLADFKAFLRAAHARGIRVITELVLNHTSDQHSWFQRARRSKPGSVWRDFYVWSGDTERYRESRIIFKDFETSNWSWDPVASAYYWHRFYHHQPDLNFDNPEVIKSLLTVVNFWLDMGVDGLRLDAIPYLYEREGTHCENLPETHAFLKQLRRQVDHRFRNRMLLAEANQWPEAAAAYFGNGDECQMAFHFPVMPRMFMALRMEDRFPIVDILAQTPPIPETCQWALFLRNHDELTLEMVTDEERDYMYRVYAHDPQMRINLGIRRRLSSLLGKDRNKTELMKGLLFSLPGSPVLYYGDEIGMGDNIYLGDRNSVRTPMQWSADRNAGFSKTSPHRLYLPVVIEPESHYEVFNVEAQQNNPHSILWWMKRLISMRKECKAFGRGSLEFLHPHNHRVLAFVRRYRSEVILVIANLSRFVQFASVDLSAFRGASLLELFGRTEFPPIGESPYFITLAPHCFYWFSVTPQKAAVISPGGSRSAMGRPVLEVSRQWTNALAGGIRQAIEESLPAYLKSQPWFMGKERAIKSAAFSEIAPVAFDPAKGCLTHVLVEYTEEDPEVYVVPLAFAAGGAADQIRTQSPAAVIAPLTVRHAKGASTGVIYDGLFDASLCKSLVELIVRRRHLRGFAGKYSVSPIGTMRLGRNSGPAHLEPLSSRASETDSTVVFGDRLELKIFRRAERGAHPSIELGRFLDERVSFPHGPKLAGAIEYRSRSGGAAAVGLLQKFVPNEGDAWSQALGALSLYFDRTVTRNPEEARRLLPRDGFVDLLLNTSVPASAGDLIGPYFESVKLLGRRSAELHIALSSSADTDFAPEPFSVLYQRSLYQSMRNQLGRTFQLLRKRLDVVPSAALDEALALLDSESGVLNRFRLVLSPRIDAKRTRTHGNFHLAEVLYTGRDYAIVNFEGEAWRPLTERRIKRSPLRDVASMLRSFHNAAYTSLFGQMGAGPAVRLEDLATLEPWARLWSVWVSSIYLQSYVEHAIHGGFLPSSREQQRTLLIVYLIERALFEIRSELTHRPEWVRIPIIGIAQLMDGLEAAA